jgi:ParB family chromosome partitioning protein
MNKHDPRKAPDHKALGKGLAALLPRREAPAVSVTTPPPETAAGVQTVPIGQVRPNPNQPRRQFEEKALLELSQSIEREGVIQPILVRRVAPDQYQIIAGERRWRAASLAGLTEVPVIAREADDEKALELAIVENIQREDLNPIELAVAFERMASELSLSHEEIGQKTGKDRATITNSIRLLQLPPAIQDLVSARKLTAGHARAILKVPGPEAQLTFAEKCIAEGWSVRQIEEATKPGVEPGDEIVERRREQKTIDPNVRAAIEDLEAALGTRVRIREKGRGKGVIELEYYSDEDLDRLYTLIVHETTT